MSTLIERLRAPAEADVSIETCRLLDEAADRIEALERMVDNCCHAINYSLAEMRDGAVLRPKVEATFRAAKAAIPDAGWPS